LGEVCGDVERLVRERGGTRLPIENADVDVAVRARGSASNAAEQVDGRQVRMLPLVGEIGRDLTLQLIVIGVHGCTRA
jgi:hypothetical protein